ncbi:hypothetical protein SAMN03097708_01199 [Thiohalomonas denitrificans]|uniref:Uncharacterized protein n=1 Tax=Thiohalomonas denitrificans TaxID=415747 RepID=A0A1G5Q287_9GAMM|nr:hypothetical protein SAMN03097708_01199 [Thiohalomonas denitrificans]
MSCFRSGRPEEAPESVTFTVQGLTAPEGAEGTSETEKTH